MAKISAEEPCPCTSGRLFKDCHGPRVKQPPPVTSHVSLRPIPAPLPDTRSVFERLGEGTLFLQGFATGLSFDCGKCSAPLMQGMEIGQVGNLVLRCNACGTYNETDDPGPPP